MLRIVLAMMFLFTGSNVWAAINDLPGAPESVKTPDAVVRLVSSGTQTFDGNDPTMAKRLFRDAIPSQCDPAKAFPGTLADNPPYRYKTFTYKNTGPGTCVTVQLDTMDCGTNVHLVAYLGSFNPEDMSENYLGDVGSSLPQSFSFSAPVGATVVIVAHQNNSESICGFSFSSNELSNPVPASIPSMNSIGALLMVLVLLTFAMRQMRRSA
ncbi:MAG: hypothetical protein C4518_08325 [Desulfobacteraceae bacterium]|nr:MAG: hypothetical protein C4518_08325 [Desulfobacteraceae bacterium]